MMGVIVARPVGPGDCDYDGIVASLCRLFGAELVDPDYYTTLLARQRKFAEEHGLAPNCEPIQCTVRVAEKHGVQREVRVPFCGGRFLTGRLDRLGCLFSAYGGTEPSTREVVTLVVILEHAGLEVEILGFREDGAQ